MKVATRTLEILFHEMSPGEIAKQLRTGRWQLCLDTFEEWFLDGADNLLADYSIDEDKLIFSKLKKDAAEWIESSKKHTKASSDADETKNWQLPDLAFAYLGKTSENVLRLQNQLPYCKIEKTLSWRDLFLSMGQDIFVCAFLAKEDCQAQQKRVNFAWPSVIRTDHASLNALLDRGLAENHQHLNGSSQTLALSWLDLMNHPDDHSLLDNKRFQAFRKPTVLHRDNTELVSLHDQVRLACVLRLFLFEKLKSPQETGNANHTPAAQLSLQRLLEQRWLQHEVLARIKKTRLQYAKPVAQEDGTMRQLDYLLTEEIMEGTQNEPCRALAGERYFLYENFRLLYNGKTDSDAKWAFYLYIVLKGRFRSEMIQLNKRRGFANFAKYEERKDVLFEHRPQYWAEHIRIALCSPIAEGRITSLETRVSPKNSPHKNYLRVQKIERARVFAVQSAGDPTTQSLKKPDWKQLSQSDDHVFYLFHFIKSKDASVDKKTWPYLYRHKELRHAVRKQAIALATMLSNSEYLCSKVRGIDSASNEIGCPPEVFATAFRFLRGFHATAFRKKILPLTIHYPILSATYHVGEDFLDIASALRAIDEAVSFLELQRGDRIGHALGLGVMPKIHYDLKGRRVYIRKQDRLDDIVWLLYRGRDLGAKINPDLYGRLKKEAEILLTEIYTPLFSTCSYPVSLTDYHCAMQLRGDDPERYRTGTYQEPIGLHSPYEQYQVSLKNPSLEHYRKVQVFSTLYYLYHFDAAVKAKGHEVCEVTIDSDYMQLVKHVQDGLQADLAAKGIAIECNPSSNVLIGTIQSYSNHPVFRFNHTHLSHGESKNCLSVCVNTDDLGVFDTSLEFEYALLFQTLDEQKNEDGSKRFTTSEVLDYLEHLRQMGHVVAFPSNKDAPRNCTRAD